MSIRRFTSLFSLLVILLFSLKSGAQDYFCISVDSASGKVSVTCHPADYTLVSQYDISFSDFSGANPGSATIFPTGPEDSYAIPGSNGLTTRYLVNVIFQPSGTSPYSNPVSSIKLAITPLSQNIAKLDWNTFDQALPGVYSVERYEAPIWRTIGSIQFSGGATALSYRDTISHPFCNLTTVYYRVTFDQFPLAAGCLSLSNLVSGSFKDQTQPEMPENDTVSIITNIVGGSYSLVLGWSDSPSPDVAGYKILRSITGSGTFDSIGYVPAGGNQYVDLTATPCTDLKEYYYAIVATDGCNNGSPNIQHAISPHNLVLVVPEIDPCEKKVHLSWNNYSNMPGGLGGYRVYRQINSGSFTIVTTVGGSVTNYDDSLQFINGNDYTYYIQAISQTGAGSSTSCLKRIRYFGPSVPDTIYIEQASVIDDDYVEVRYYSYPANRISTLLLERADTITGTFQPVDTLIAPVNGFLPQEYHLTDYSADVHNRSYVYRLTMIDSCEKATLYSFNYARNILLSCVPSGTNSNLLSWNGYESWIEGVKEYKVYRKVNGILDPTGPLTVNTGPPFTYVDDLNALLPTAEGCYYIEASENPGNPFFSEAVSVSNEACSIRDPIFKMPNAFNPGGHNRRFRPVSAFVDATGFSMLIFNQWGQQIFETNDIFNGWDGNVNGEEAPSGVYIYKISYKSSQGDTFETKGLVTLLR